jgi:light-harvesting complex I chlorophyll a/b binding protein 1
MASSALASLTRLSGASLFTAASQKTATYSNRTFAPIRAVADDPAAPDATATPPDVLKYAKELPGVTLPFPNIFDPATLLARAASSARPIKELKRWRESEIVHGRVAMLATLGFIVGEQVEDFPARFFPHVTGPAIYHFQQVEQEGAIFWEPLIFAIALAESYRVGLGWATPDSTNFNTLREDYEPGNLGFDPLGLLPTDPEARKDMQSKELNNGRLAMIAIAGFVAQELVSQQGIFEHLFKRLGLD